MNTNNLGEMTAFRNKLGIILSVELDKQDIIKVTVAPSSVPISYNGKYYIRSGSTGKGTYYTLKGRKGRQRGHEDAIKTPKKLGVKKGTRYLLIHVG